MFEAEEIEELLDMEYGDRRVFALLSLLYPFEVYPIVKTIFQAN